jgi:hypothetical protein
MMRLKVTLISTGAGAANAGQAIFTGCLNGGNVIAGVTHFLTYLSGKLRADGKKDAERIAAPVAGDVRGICFAVQCRLPK